MSVQKFVRITLTTGEEKLLKFDYNAVADIEEYFKRGIGAIFAEENVGFNTLRIFYWAGLKWKNRGLTVQAVGDMLGSEMENGKDIGDLMEPILNALTKSKLLGDSKPEDEAAAGGEDAEKN